MSTDWIPVSDPPKKPGWYLVDNPGWSTVNAAGWDGQRWYGGITPTHWRELPPRAPKPDPFDVWWSGLLERADGFREVGPNQFTSKLKAWFIWDAAMKAKEQGK